MHLYRDVHFIIRIDVPHILCKRAGIIVKSEWTLNKHLEPVKFLLESFSLWTRLVGSLYRRYKYLTEPLTIDFIKVLSNMWFKELCHIFNRFIDECSNRWRMDEKTIRWNTTKPDDTDTAMLVDITLLLLVNIQFLILIHWVEVEEQFMQTGLNWTIDSNVTSLEFILSNDNWQSIDNGLYDPVLTFNREGLTNSDNRGTILLFEILIFWNKHNFGNFDC